MGCSCCLKTSKATRHLGQHCGDLILVESCHLDCCSRYSMRCLLANGNGAWVQQCRQARGERQKAERPGNVSSYSISLLQDWAEGWMGIADCNGNKKQKQQHNTNTEQQHTKINNNHTPNNTRNTNTQNNKHINSSNNNTHTHTT